MGNRRIMTDKYLVFPVSADKGDYSTHCFPTDTAIGDAVVIRLQDVFSSSAFYAYANEIRTSTEVIHELFKGFESSLPGSVKGQINRLEEIADYFFDMAMKAEEYQGKKVPD
jgi:hypothetical protein